MHPELFRIFGYIAKKHTPPHKAYSKLTAIKVEYDNHFPLYGASLLRGLYLQVTLTLAYIITAVFRCFAVQMQVLVLDGSPCDKIWRETFNIAGQMQSLTVPYGCLSSYFRFFHIFETDIMNKLIEFIR